MVAVQIWNLCLFVMEYAMNNLRCVTTALLLVSVVTAFGCKSKQEPPTKPGASTTKSGAPAQDAGAIKSISGQMAGGAIATSGTDKADAEAAAARVLGQMEAGEFSALYQEASPAFQKIGTEAAFVARFQQARQKTGPLKDQKQTSFVTRDDRAHVLVYRMENDQFKTERRLTFARSKDGKMALQGLNQHDEPKNPPVK
jgi:hypothetical protein